MRVATRARLSTMMFLEYFIWGAWYVTLGTWLSQSLHFSGQQVGIAAGATAVGAMISPFFVSLMTDTLYSTEKVLAALHLAGATLLFAASRQTAFGPLYGFVLLYCFCFMPTLALTNSLAFRQMENPQEEFSFVRVLGTLGWIVAGLTVGSLGLEATKIPVLLAAGASVVMAVYCLTLPHTPPLSSASRPSLKTVFPPGAVKMLKRREVAIFALASLLICIPLQFYYAFTNLFLNQIGVKNAASIMTGGQMSELLCMLFIPWFFRRLGVKWMLVAAMIAWAARYVLFALGAGGTQVWALWGGILLHGICYDFFFVTGQIYIDRKAAPELRAAAQGLITFLTYGVGMFVGSWVSGYVVEHYTLQVSATGPVYAWHSIWIFASVCSGVILLLFLVFFSDREGELVESDQRGRSRSRLIPQVLQ